MMPSVAILAGGLATRLYPLTQTIPKALLDIGGKPFIAHQLALLRRSQIRQVVICAGFLGEQIQAIVQDGRAFGLRVEYSSDGHQLLGTGGAIKKALPLLSDPFFVLYGDSYLDTDFQPIAAYYQIHQPVGLMTVLRNNDQWDTSNIVYRNHTIVRYDKTERTPEMQHIDYGLSLLRKSCFDTFAPDTKFDLAAVYQELIRQGAMAGYEVTQRFYEIGSFHGLEETRAYIETRGV